MKYQHLTIEQQAQEKKGRLTALERKHYLRTMDLTEAQARAEAAAGEDLKEAMVSVGQIIQDLASLELSIQALNGK